MPDAHITQPTFTAGELSDRLYGRKDLAKYQVGVRKARNVIIHSTGGMSNRAGLRFIGEAKDSTKETRITAFEAAGDEAFLLAWGDLNVRPIWRGAFVDNVGSPYEVETVYTHLQLGDLYQAQSNDVLSLAHPLYPIQELRRYAALDWQFEGVDFGSTVPIPLSPTATAVNAYTGYDASHDPRDYVYVVAAITDRGEESLPSQEAETSIPLVMGYDKNFVTITWTTDGLQDYGTGTPGRVFRAWGTRVDRKNKLEAGRTVASIRSYSKNSDTGLAVKIVQRTAPGVYSIIQTQTFSHRGGGWQTVTLNTPYVVPGSGDFYAAIYAPDAPASGDNALVYAIWNSAAAYVQSNPGVSTGVAMGESTDYSWGTRVRYASDSTENIVEYEVYREDNGVFGSIGRTPDLSFVDRNILPDFTKGPVSGENPFEDAGNYPRVVFFAQQRRGFASTLEQPQTIFMTQSANFNSMAASTPTRETDAFNFTLAAEKKQDIFHVVAVEQGLLAFTRSGEWKIAGRDGDILSPSSILPEPQSEYGTNRTMKPLIIGENVLFGNRTQNAVFQMEYSFQVDRYTANDLTLLADHLFRNRKVVAWAHAADPFGLIWCVMDDGTALSLTYLKDHDVWGWCQHDTLGKFLDVAVVPEDGRDVPYFVVERTVGGVKRKYYEYMVQRNFDVIEDAFFVDSGLTFDNPVAIVGVTPGATTSVNVTAHGLTTGDEIEIDGVTFVDDQGVTVGSLDGVYLVTVTDANNFTIEHAQLGDEIEIGDPVDTSAYVGLDVVLGVMRKRVDTFSGLGHLEGHTVVALVDGMVVNGIAGEPLVVTGGALPAFPFKGARVHIGLPYRSHIQTLDLVNTGADDTGITKGVGTYYLRVKDTRGIKTGQTPEIDEGEDYLAELYAREDEGYYAPPDLISDITMVGNFGEWSNGILLDVVQDYPLPMTILGVTESYEHGDS